MLTQNVRGEYFHELPSIHKIRENILPRKFPTIRYVKGSCKAQTKCRPLQPQKEAITVTITTMLMLLFTTTGYMGMITNYVAQRSETSFAAL